MKLKRTRRLMGQSLFLAAGVAMIAYGCGGAGGTGGGGPVTPPGYTAANGMTGGKSYAAFWVAQAGWSQADPNLTFFTAKPDFFTCKQCHGWDLKGNRGFYVSRAATANRPNVDGLDLRAFANTRSPQEIFDAIAKTAGRRAVNVDLSTYHPTTNNTVGDQMPNYRSFMSDAQIWNIVKFLKQDSIDVSMLYDATVTGVYPTGSIAFSDIGKGGSAANGHSVYTNRCGGCHGADGKLNMPGTSIGKYMRAKPNEAQHKIKFGQLGSSMGLGPYVNSLQEMKDLYRATQDATRYPD